MFLLDTNVISEIRRNKPHGAVLEWISAAHVSMLNVSVVTIGEIQEGIELTRRSDADKADEIENWLTRVTETFVILPIDTPTVRLWAKLMFRQSDHLSEYAMIAATAFEHDLTVVTRNTRDFEGFGVRVLNPFERR